MSVENTGSHALDVVLGTTTLSVDAANSAVFYADGTANGLATVVGSSTASVSSVAFAVPNEFAETGSPITSSGTFVLERGALVVVAASAGATNDLDPGSGFPVGIDRVDVTLGSGAANWTGLKAGGDGQRIILSNQDAANALTLNKQNAGSTAANRFVAVDDMVLMPGQSWMLVYCAGSVNRWRIVA